jgi:tetraacyldisaccharide 4'-kinase
MKWSDLYWHRITPLHFILWPLSLLFSLLMALRRFCYWLDLFPTTRLPIPVIVIDSITVEDSGKTPLVIWLVNFLKSRGLRPGIITQGFTDNPGEPVAAKATSDPAIVGSKPLLLVQRCGKDCPIWVGYDRIAVAHALLAANPDCNILINDDGLQYHRLQRDMEIAVVDFSEQNFGNGLMLPAGPLRDSLKRLNNANAIVMNSATKQQLNIKDQTSIHNMKLMKDTFYNLMNPDSRVGPSAFSNKRLHAISDLDNAQWFFDHLNFLRLSAKCHTFKKNHRFLKQDIQIPAAEAILMTEEDAIQCYPFAKENLWALPVDIVIDTRLQEVTINKIREKFKVIMPLNTMVCPLCKKSIKYRQSENDLVCESDQLAFPIIDGIPVIQETSARKLS